MSQRSLLGVAAVVAVAVLTSLPVPGATTSESYVIAPEPSWVVPADVPGPSESPDARAGVIDLLDDEQHRVSAATVERFHRHVTRILSTAGLEAMSQLEIEFDPAYERLVFHHVRILRGERTVDALSEAEINVVQKESELDEQLYSGALTAIVFLEGIRPGDLVDYAYSIDGANPVFDGRYAGAFELDADYPIRLLRRRLLMPEQRPVQLAYTREEMRPEVRELDGETEYVWSRADVPALDEDANAPSWYQARAVALVGEYASWSEVVAWALRLYRPGALSPEMREQIASWRARPTDEERFLAALRFVQDEVRYLGIELGAGSHQPAAPEVCFERRFGDCKDKSLLLVTLLGAMGIEAHPALVHTALARAIDGWPPSPLAFDHVIVRATVEGRTVWVDPTAAQQRGRLDRLAPLDYERALVIRDGVTGLEVIPIPAPASATTLVEQVYTVTSFDEPAMLEVRTTYAGVDADAVRYNLSQRPATEIARDSLNLYAETYYEIEEADEIAIRDDERENVVTISERYRIPNFWRESEREVLADAILAEASIPRGGRRTAPLAVPYPIDVAQRILVRLPEPVYVDEESGTVADGFVEFSYKRASDDEAISLDYRYRTLADNVPPAKVSEHIGTLEKVHRLAGYRFTRDAVTASAPGLWMTAALAGALVAPFAAAAIVLGARRARRKQASPLLEAPPPRNAGEAPETAISIDGEGAVDRFVSRQRCSCGASLAPVGRDAFLYDGRHLTVVGLDCPSCGTSRDVYFERD